MSTHFDRDKCLDDLEEKDWGECEYESNLVKTCHGLRKKPLSEFTVGDLRIMIGQSISLHYLVPLALEQLEVDPWIEAEFFRGDLLKALVQADRAFWQRRTDLLGRLQDIVQRAKQLLPSLEDYDRKTADDVLAEAIAAFE